MDCSSNQRSSCTRRPQTQMPPYMNTGCGCDRMDGYLRPSRPSQPVMPSQPQIIPGQGPMTRPVSAPAAVSNNSMDRFSCFPVGMGYVPWQRWSETYPLDQGFMRGTIFPELDLPFVMGRCRG